jgi:tRNA (mo5U34)-methyltransferase
VPTDLELRDEIVRLGPWHYDVQVTPEVSTRAFLDAPPGTYPKSFGPVTFLEPRDRFKGELLRIYPGGLEGRTVMDCACNCGGYLFWAKEAGAGGCFGFDAREHWINQAKFLREHRVDASDMRFEVCDLYDVPKLDLEPFDIALFQGIFYHLPDPIEGLKIAADLTKELLIVGTATRSGMPDGCLYAEYENTDLLMSGIHGPSWRPTGPEVLDRMLKWMGFVETRVVNWKKETPSHGPDGGRLRLAASKTEGLLEALGEPRIEERAD